MKNRIAIIPSDNIIIVDNETLCFEFEALDNIHAIQWSFEEGQIEYIDGSRNTFLSGDRDYAQNIAPFVELFYTEKKRLEDEANRPSTLEELQVAFVVAIQTHLDQFAQTRNYYDIMSVATYTTSSVPEFKIEGQYAVEARDLTWAKAYAILNDVLSGARPMPMIEEVIAELPTLAWPEGSLRYKASAGSAHAVG